MLRCKLKLLVMGGEFGSLFEITKLLSFWTAGVVFLWPQGNRPNLHDSLKQLSQFPDIENSVEVNIK